MQPWWISFSILNQSIIPYSVLTVSSWPAYRFLRRQVRWSSIPTPVRTFQFVMIHTVKGFGVVSEAEVDFFLEFLCFFYYPMNDGNLISDFSSFTKSSLYIWKFSGLKDFEHYIANMWNESNYIAVWRFFGIAFLWDWNENWPFPVLWPLLNFFRFASILSAVLYQHHLLGFEIVQLEFHHVH